MSGLKGFNRRRGHTKIGVVAWLMALVFIGQPALFPSQAQEAVLPQPVDFTLAGIDGKPVSLSSYRGRWVILNFWATWCSPCLREIPELSWFHEKYNAKAIVIGVNYETIDATKLRRFIKKHGIVYPVVRIGSEPLTPFEPLLGLPSTFFVSPQGNYVARHIGVITARDIEAVVKEAGL